MNIILEFGTKHMATTSIGAERSYRRVRGNVVENAERSSESSRNRPEAPTRLARERGTEGGSRGTDSDFRETISQCSTRVY